MILRMLTVTVYCFLCIMLFNRTLYCVLASEERTGLGHLYSGKSEETMSSNPRVSLTQSLTLKIKEETHLAAFPKPYISNLKYKRCSNND